MQINTFEYCKKLFQMISDSNELGVYKKCIEEYLKIIGTISSNHDLIISENKELKENLNNISSDVKNSKEQINKCNEIIKDIESEISYLRQENNKLREELLEKSVIKVPPGEFVEISPEDKEKNNDVEIEKIEKAQEEEKDNKTEEIKEIVPIVKLVKEKPKAVLIKKSKLKKVINPVVIKEAQEKIAQKLSETKAIAIVEKKNNINNIMKFSDLEVRMQRVIFCKEINKEIGKLIATPRIQSYLENFKRYKLFISGMAQDILQKYEDDLFARRQITTLSKPLPDNTTLLFAHHNALQGFDSVFSFAVKKKNGDMLDNHVFSLIPSNVVSGVLNMNPTTVHRKTVIRITNAINDVVKDAIVAVGKKNYWLQPFVMEMNLIKKRLMNSNPETYITEEDISAAKNME